MRNGEKFMRMGSALNSQRNVLGMFFPNLKVSSVLLKTYFLIPFANYRCLLK